MKKIISLTVLISMLITCAYAEMPRPYNDEVNMIIGECTGDYYTDVLIYYETGNGIELTGINRNIYVPEGGSLVEETLHELFANDDGKNYIFPMPSDTYIKRVEISCGVATVDLAVNMGGLRNEGELLSMLMAVSNTLIRLDGVDYVNVLINSRHESIYGLPLGVISDEETSIAAVWSGLQAESEFFTGASETGMPLEREAILYYPSVNGQWILPEVRSITFNDKSYADNLLAELMKGPSGGDAYTSFISNGANILTEKMEVHISATGERILSISLSGIIRDYLLLQDIPEWQFVGALTLTMTSFIPEVDGVQLFIDGEEYSQLNIKGQYRKFQDGIMHRDDFEMYIGSTGILYFSDNNGGLIPIQRAMSTERANSPYALIIQLISGPSVADAGAFRTMPAGITANDLLGVEVSEGIATVNMSSDFYRLCQVLNEEEERVLVYSIVDTLCKLPGINAVRILIEGEIVETLADSIFLIGDLMYNPGIIR